MKHPDKWRETADISALAFSNIEVLEILGYPHAGNDVIHVRVRYRDGETNAFIKVERQFGADIANEISIISALHFPFAPQMLDYSLTEPRFIVTKEACGERLSYIADNSPDTDINAYLSLQATVLSQFHSLQIPCEAVKGRRFFHLPPSDFFADHDLCFAGDFLDANPPQLPSKCFVHGDFHYANILWDGGSISCVLDYELSGLGIREFDMAWAIFLRPGQKFGLSWDSVEAFLSGYTAEFCMTSFRFYYVQIACHFYPLGDDIYRQRVKMLIERAISA